MKKPEKYLTTGEFAKICGVKKQTLFHYDQMGILSPEILGENGYRYYSYLQLDKFTTISMLKELDMPLADIKKYLDKRNPDDFLDLLQQHSELVDEKIKELQRLKKFIQDRIAITKEGVEATHGKIFIETRPEEYYIFTEYSGESDDNDIYAALAQHLAYCRKHDIYSPYAIGGLVETSAVNCDENYNYTHFYTQIDADDVNESASITVIPAQSYICTYSTKGFGHVLTLFKELMDYAKAQDLNVGSHFFEDMLLDEMSCFGFDQYTLKISLPIVV